MQAYHRTSYAKCSNQKKTHALRLLALLCANQIAYCCAFLQVRSIDCALQLESVIVQLLLRCPKIKGINMKLAFLCCLIVGGFPSHASTIAFGSLTDPIGDSVLDDLIFGSITIDSTNVATFVLRFTPS